MSTNTTALEYLDALIETYCQRTPAFSFRWLAERCRLKSPNFIQQVLGGKKGLECGPCCSHLYSRAGDWLASQKTLWQPVARGLLRPSPTPP